MTPPSSVNPQDYTRFLRTTEARKSMVLIYGPPVTGKTTGARTFPNPIIVDFDNNLPPGTPNVIPMWDDNFVNALKPKFNKAWPANRRDALMLVLADLAATLPANHTVIIDSLTRIESWYDAQEAVEPPPLDKENKPNKFELFRRRLLYFNTLFSCLVSCPANVVFLAHQQQERDDKGNLIGQLKPALIGQIGDKLPGFFPIVLQTARRLKKDSPTEVEFLWRVRPGNWEPARVPKPTTIDFISQDYNELAKLL